MIFSQNRRLDLQAVGSPAEKMGGALSRTTVMIQKTELIDRILETLREELAGMKEGARDAYEEATHEESQPENRFDTHSLEASYRAAGQAKLVVEIESAIMKCQNMNLSDFGPDDPIGVGALVKLKSKRETGCRRQGKNDCLRKGVFTPDAENGGAQDRAVGRYQGQKDT